MAPRPALAQEGRTVAVLEVQGAPKGVQAAMMGTLKKAGWDVIPMPRWNAAAKRLNATGRAADEIAMVAGDLGALVVVTGTVKKDKDGGGWVLSVAVRHGPTGKPVERLRYPLKGPRVDAATQKQLLSELVPAAEKAQQGPPDKELKPEAEPRAEDLAPVPPALQEENPFEQLKKAEDERKKAEKRERPKWYPYVDAGLGLIVGGRRFAFDEDPGTSPEKCFDFDRVNVDASTRRIEYRYTSALRKCPGFSASITSGLRLDVTGYPLAFLPYGPLRGLGIGATFDVLFWPASRACTKGPDGSCVTPGPDLDTREFRLEAGLRWAWNIANRRSRPSLLVSLQYGLHTFAIQKETEPPYDIVDPDNPNMTRRIEDGVNDHGLPDLRYQYIDIAMGGRIPYHATDRFFFGLLLDFHFHAMLDYGDIQTRFIDFLRKYGGYGPVSGGYGLRAGLTPIEFGWKGLTVRAHGYYELFAMSFELFDPSPATTGQIRTDRETVSRHLARSAKDHYFGGILQVGYQY